MKITMTRIIYIHDSNGYGWAKYTQFSNSNEWNCNPGGDASSGFFKTNTEFKPRMSDNDMMLLVLKYSNP